MSSKLCFAMLWAGWIAGVSVGCRSAQTTSHHLPAISDAQPPAPPSQWLSAGHDDNNSRSQPLEHNIDRDSVGRLGIKWFFETEGDVWATPAVDEAAVYVPDGS